MIRFSTTADFSSALRDELRERNIHFAKKHVLPHCESYGTAPVIVYEPFDSPERHGNFFDASYSAILSNMSWQRRLAKVHTSSRAALPRRERKWCELDSSMSSDALLMNIFCCPKAMDAGVRGMLGIGDDALPQFGIKARVPLANGRFDRTEVDMQIGTLLCEAKLTEGDFQQKAKAILGGYRDFRQVFDRKLLPQTRENYLGYQLIRNVLAAFATDAAFCVLLDERRPDLREQWYAVMSAVRDADMRVRCKVLTWQELSSFLPERLRTFLDEKYGIVPPGEIPSEIHPSAIVHLDE